MAQTRHSYSKSPGILGHSFFIGICLATFALTVTTDNVRANHTAPAAQPVNLHHTITPGDGTPLTRAVAMGNTELAAALLAQGADINQPVPLEGSALIVATRSDDSAMIRFLLTKGAKINQVVSGDETALITASRLDRVSIARQLIAAGADINLGVNADTTGGKVWRTPLNQANSQTMRALLIDAGAREDGPTLRYR